MCLLWMCKHICYFMEERKLEKLSANSSVSPKHTFGCGKEQITRSSHFCAVFLQPAKMLKNILAISPIILKDQIWCYCQYAFTPKTCLKTNKTNVCYKSGQLEWRCRPNKRAETAWRGGSQSVSKGCSLSVMWKWTDSTTGIKDRGCVSNFWLII